MARNYSPEYKETVFQVWYAGNRLPMKRLHLSIPEFEGGRPTPEMLNQWKVHNAWIDRANFLDDEVRTKMERELVEMRVEMMKRHAEIAKEVIEMAIEKLRDGGFDTSASAVQALKVAFEEEKRSRGAEVSLTKLNEMNDEQLSAAFRQLTGQISGVDTVDGEVEEEFESTEEE